jgi:hypothetical protein
VGAAIGSALDDTSIGDYRLAALFVEKSLKAILEFCNTICHQRTCPLFNHLVDTGEPVKPSPTGKSGSLRIGWRPQDLSIPIPSA